MIKVESKKQDNVLLIFIAAVFIGLLSLSALYLLVGKRQPQFLAQASASPTMVLPVNSNEANGNKEITTETPTPAPAEPIPLDENGMQSTQVEESEVIYGRVFNHPEEAIDFQLRNPEVKALDLKFTTDQEITKYLLVYHMTAEQP